MKVSRYYMPSVSLRQLRDTRRLKTWLQSGNTVELLERDRVIARIVPASRAVILVDSGGETRARQVCDHMGFIKDTRTL